MADDPFNQFIAEYGNSFCSQSDLVDAINDSDLAVTLREDEGSPPCFRIESNNSAFTDDDILTFIKWLGLSKTEDEYVPPSSSD